MDRIVVGVDGSEGARRALRWALDEARRWGASVEAVMAWDYLSQRHPASAAFDPAYDQDAAKAFLHEEVTSVAGPAPDVEVRSLAVLDHPASALLVTAKGADLLVVGARGLGGFRGLLLGSVSQQCAEHARCPVVVVPPETEEGER